MDNIENTGIESDGEDMIVETEGESFESESGEVALSAEDRDALMGDDGIAIEGQGVTAAEADATKPESKGPPAYLAFLEGVRAEAEALGLQSKDQKGFFQVWNAATGHKLYVAKQGRKVTRVDTTLPTEQLGDIWLPLEKPNGRIVCHVQPSVEAVSLALTALASFGEKIPSPRRAAKAETTTAG